MTVPENAVYQPMKSYAASARWTGSNLFLTISAMNSSAMLFSEVMSVMREFSYSSEEYSEPSLKRLTP